MMMNNDTIQFTAMTGAATGTAELIGAAFGLGGAMIQQHPDWNGIGLQMFASGMSMTDVAQFILGTPAFQSMVGGASTNDAFVDAVYHNVTGMVPTQTQHDYYVGLLQGGGGNMTQADLLVYAANTDANLQHIDLVGLQQTGMAFMMG